MKRKELGLSTAFVAAGLLAAFALLVGTEAARAGDQVVTNTNDSGAGSLRQAISEVSEGGIITFNLGP